MREAPASTAGMPKDVSRDFLREVSFFLFSSWKIASEESFDKQFRDFKDKYLAYDGAKSLIEKLEEKKHQLVAFYTKVAFLVIIILP